MDIMFSRGANMAIDRGLMSLGSRYPAVRLAAPLAKIAARPMVNFAHEALADSSLNGYLDQREELGLM